MNAASQKQVFPWFLLTVFLCLVLGILLTGFLIYQNLQNKSKEDTYGSLAAIADLKVGQIVQWRHERLGDALIIRYNAALCRQVKSYLSTPKGPHGQELVQWMKSFGEYNGYATMSLLDTKGTIRLSTAGLRDSIDSDERQFVIDALRSHDIMLSDLHSSGIAPNILMDIVVPIVDPDRTDTVIISVLLLRINPYTILFPLVQKWPTPSSTAETLILERDGDEVVFLNELKFRPNSALKLRFPVSDEQLPAAIATRGIDSMVKGIDYRNVPVLAALRKIPHSPWFMVSKVDQEEVYAPLRIQAWIVGSAVFFLIISAGSIIGLWWRHQRALFYRKQYEAELERQALATHFDYIVKYANDVMLLMNTDGKIVEANDQACRTYGYTREELFQLNIRDLRSEESRNLVDTQLKQVGDRGGMVFETQHRRKNGTIFPVEVSSRLIRIEDAKFYQSIIRDITERKAAEEDLQKREAQQSLVLSTLPMAFYIAQPFGDYSRTWLSEQIDYITGFTEEQFHSDLHLWASRLHPDDRERGLAEFAKIVEKGSLEVEYRWQIADGRYRWFMDRAVLTRDAGGNPKEVIGTWLDITERKEAEETLRALSARNEAILAAAPDIIMEVDVNKVYRWANPAGLEFFGNDVIGKEASFYFEGEQETYGHIQPIFEGQENTLYVESWQRRKDGEKRLLAWRCRSLKDGQGNVTGALSTAQDITEQKRAEEALRESEERYRYIFERSPIGIGIATPNGRIISVNKSMIAIIGYTAEELKEINIGDSYVDPGRRTEMLRLLSQSGSVFDFPAKLRRKDGSQYDALLNVTQIKLGDRDFLQTIVQDITNRKRTEEALRESEEKYKILFADARQAIFIADVESGMLIDCNEAACALIERSRDEIVGKHQSVLHPTDELVGGSSLSYRRHISDGAGLLLEDKVITKSGKIKDVEIKGNLVEFRGKKILQGFFIDITERKRAEAALKESEERFRRLVGSVTDYIYSVKLDAGQPSATLHGPACVTVTGYTSAEYESDPGLWFRMVHEDDRQAVQELTKKVLSGADVLPLEHRIVHKNGSVRWVRNTPVLKHDDRGLLISYDGLIADITERKEAEEALRLSHAFNDMLVQTLPFGMDIVDEEGRILFMSNAMKDIAGADASGLRCWQSYKDDKQQCHNCPLKYDIVFGRTAVLETAGVFGGRTFQISHVGMMYEGKKAMLEVFQDITEQKRMQQELLQSQKMLSIGTLAGGIAHDFNNILGIILGYISIMQSIKDNPQKFSEGIHAIRQAVDRGAGLVRQILTFARKAEVSFEPLYLPDLVKELVSMLQQTFPKIITFQTSFDKQLPLINADYTQIHQALLNLCVNARDALPNGGEISIKVSSLAGEKIREQFPAANLSAYLCVGISDTGVGMEESTRSRIFDPFFTTKEKGKGTGLGLSVVYGVVQAHHGFINCESHIDEGATFRIYLPVPEEPASTRRPQIKEESIASAGNETILLVEDEDLLLEMMETLLKTRGYGVFTAKDGIEAVELYKQHKNEISLVLTDMGLPKLTGIDEFERLKDINPNVRLIFASGYLDPRAKDDLLKAGAKGFLQKPYVIEEVLKKVREVLSSK
jgi:two-component system cell cycle sensor histidine kinase/response regulator CckA